MFTQTAGGLGQFKVSHTLLQRGLYRQQRCGSSRVMLLESRASDRSSSSHLVFFSPAVKWSVDGVSEEAGESFHWLTSEVLLTGTIVCKRVNLSESVTNRVIFQRENVYFKVLLKACFRSIMTLLVYLLYILKPHYFIISKITNAWVNLSELVINAGHISPHNKKCKKKKKKKC